ncbi:heavy metal translocating P-type ATPase, partial [Nakamurella sp.]|uniref:heavy metal translocating P-type ATPase n=1 Tax=Nakamurella sp. TaxID=1869182 RepID=UPI003B3A8F33
MTWWRHHGELVLFVASTTLLVVGLAGRLVGMDTAAEVAWVTGAALGLVVAVGQLAAAVRQGRFSVDVIAVLALAGALLVGEPFAGAMITVMLASGQLLEARADARARRELSLLVGRAPRTARRAVAGGFEVVPVDAVTVGEQLLVGPGEIVPVDGRLLTAGVFDESALTGEPLPVERIAGDDVRSGVVNAGPPTRLRTTAAAADSTYAGVVRLVEQAQASSAPFVRVADRFAIVFVPLTLLVAGLAWLVSGDPVLAVAVLVVATPCPLLLAAPIAFMSGLSRAAAQGVIIKGGGALERLARGRVLLFDKTGTLTRGRPQVTDVVTAGGRWDADDILRTAASLDQVSAHVLASAIVTAGTRRGLPLVTPDDVVEEPGYGVRGRVDGRPVRLGKAAWVVGGTPPAWARQLRRRADLDGSLTVFVAIDGEPAGALVLQDELRPDAPRMLRQLRRAGIGRTVLITGDRADVADAVGRIVGVDAVLADRDPAGKLAVVEQESARTPTIMVGDGINDAPALAAAGVGVALAVRGASASSEAADVVLTVDRIGVLAEAIGIARRSRRIALAAVLVGMGLSLVAMVVAAVGLLPPAAGAVAQEIIDLLAIGIALLAVLPGRPVTPPLPPADVATAVALRAEHDAAKPVVERIRAVADALSTHRPDLRPVRGLLDRLESDVIPHERADERLLVPLMDRALGADAGAAISRTHAEIEHQ